MTINLSPNRIFQAVAGSAIGICIDCGRTNAGYSRGCSSRCASGSTGSSSRSGTSGARPPPPRPRGASAHGHQRLYRRLLQLNFNRPTVAANGQINDLYNFNDKTDQFNLSAAKLTLNHDPDPVGAHVDFIYGRTNDLINAAPPTAVPPISSTTLSRRS